MAYNSKMTILSYADRAAFLEKTFTMDYGEASKNTNHDNLGGSPTFAYMSKKAIDKFKIIDSSKFLRLIAAYKANEWHKAYNVFRSIGLNKNGFVAEHTIPCSVMLKWVYESKNRQTKKAFEYILKDGIFVQCGITHEEDLLLRRNGLNQKMPVTWNGKIDPDATFARYRYVGIEPVMLSKAK